MLHIIKANLASNGNREVVFKKGYGFGDIIYNTPSAYVRRSTAQKHLDNIKNQEVFRGLVDVRIEEYSLVEYKAEHKEMNKEEALVFFNGVKLNFTGYHKYRFTYSGEKDGIKIIVDFCGAGEDMYKDEYAPIEPFYDIDYESFQVIKTTKDDTLVYKFSEN